jgi:hypothetical protein
MKLIFKLVAAAALSGLCLFAADSGQASLAQAQDKMLSSVEQEVVSLAEAMPADKYGFKPTQGTFSDVRTFGQQMSHLATALYLYSSGMLGEKPPVERGKDENGPDSLNGKDAIVKYLKDAFAYAHKATATLTQQNFMETLTMPWGKITRGLLAEQSISHSFDHYGQAVVYARMNGIVPPASRRS